MVVISEARNCFKAQEVEGSNEFEIMIQGMRSRGVAVRVLPDQGTNKRFCLK